MKNQHLFDFNGSSIHYILNESVVWIKLNDLQKNIESLSNDSTSVVQKSNVEAVTGASLVPGCGKSLYVRLDELFKIWEAFLLPTSYLSIIQDTFSDMGFKVELNSSLSFPDLFVIDLGDGSSLTVPYSLIIKLVMDHFNYA